MKRLNLELTESDVLELENAKILLRAVSLTEAIRRSIRLTNKLLELQGDKGQIIVRDKDSQQSAVIVV